MPRVRRRHVEPQTLCAEDAATYCGMGVKTFRAEVQALQDGLFAKLASAESLVISQLQNYIHS